MEFFSSTYFPLATEKDSCHTLFFCFPLLSYLLSQDHVLDKEACSTCYYSILFSVSVYILHCSHHLQDKAFN